MDDCCLLRFFNPKVGVRLLSCHHCTLARHNSSHWWFSLVEKLPRKWLAGGRIPAAGLGFTQVVFSTGHTTGWNFLKDLPYPQSHCVALVFFYLFCLCAGRLPLQAGTFLCLYPAFAPFFSDGGKWIGSFMLILLQTFRLKGDVKGDTSTSSASQPSSSSALKPFVIGWEAFQGCLLLLVLILYLFLPIFWMPLVRISSS